MIPIRSRLCLPAVCLALATTARLAGQGAAPPAPAADAPVLAEDFESGSLNKSVWDVRTAGGAEVTVQSTQVHSGKSALQVHYPKGAPGLYGFIVATHLPDSVRTHCFGRAYLFISPGMPAGHDALLSAGTPGWPNSNFLELGASGGKNVMASYQQNDPKVPRGETISKANPPYPVGKWFCLEWEFNDAPDSITTWIDGQPSGELKGFSFKARAAAGAPAPTAVPGNKLVTGFSDFAFGFRYWGSAKTDYDIYYDDIVIDTKRIGPTK